MTATRLRRELSEFPFTKLKPISFRVDLAGLSEHELEKRPLRVWVEIADITKVLKIASFARVLKAYPHLNYVYVETYASELGALVASDLVRSVWHDRAMKVEGCAFVRTDPRAAPLAVRLIR